MVASSYNAGMGRISGELVKQDADSSFDLWLVEETTRYVYRIMAIKQIFEALINMVRAKSAGSV